MKRLVAQSSIPFDNISTPVDALLPLLPFLPKKLRVWECAHGMGMLSGHLLRFGYKLIAEPNDFLMWQPESCDWDCIVTNPPYSTRLRYSFLVRAYSLGRPFAFLLPYTTLETPRRQALFCKYGIELILWDERINFTGGSGNWFPVAWFTWGFNLPKQLNFVEMEPLRRKYLKV